MDFRSRSTRRRQMDRQDVRNFERMEDAAGDHLSNQSIFGKILFVVMGLAVLALVLYPMFK